MGMVERVARAMDAAGLQYIIAYEAKAKDDPTMIPWFGMADVPMTVLARAAIEAMREPTEEMIDAGIEAKMKLYERLEAEGKNTRIIVVANHPAGTIYEAMIDKALESGE